MILLRYFGQMSFREIADLYQCPLGTVLAKVHRGLAALRKLMGGQDGME
jgi:DNA-directed RNA polymerase specialized sigma24 family protein